MYGIIPRANTDAFAKAPPVKAFKIPNNPPPSVLLESSPSWTESIPGRTTCAPSL